jgi:membrane associated rhomboid family serine protease
MGIYDREYYRDERSSFLGSLNRQGQAWKTLVGINVFVFVLQLATATHGGVNGGITDWLTVDTNAILHGEVWRLLTGAFAHAGHWQHIAVNMLMLWWFGSEVEGIYGAREFTWFYLCAAVVANAAYVAVQVLAGPVAVRVPALGASGAVTAVMVLFALHFPNRLIYVFGIIPVPALLLVGIYVVLDAFGALGFQPGSNTAFTVHLGGAAFGFLYYKLHWRISGLLPTNWSLNFGRSRPRLRVYRAEPRSEPYREPVPAAAPSRPVPEGNLESELDAVLEKVARQGKSSLTEREHQILMRASEIYRNRRK